MSAVIAVPMNEIERMALAVAKSGLFGVKTADQALALMLVAQAEGRHPAMAARDYDIIQNRPSKKSEAMMRDFLENGGKVEWHALSDDKADATFSHPSGGTVRIDWTMKRAITAGLGAKDMWKKYPRQMLRARCVSEGIRTVCPMATSGMYVPEEVRDFTEKDVTADGMVVEQNKITPTAGAGESLTPERREEINELHGKVVGWLNQDAVADAVLEIDNAGLDADEKIYLWTLFDSKQRSAMKKEAKRQKDEATEKAQQAAIERHNAVESSLISDAQKKRLEAMIGESHYSRDEVKKICAEEYGKEHFADLTKAEYDKVCKLLEGDIVGSQA